MNYLVDAVLGVGPDGPVRRAVADRLGARPVAIRLLDLDDDGLAHLRRHAEALAGVGHPNLGVITDVTRGGDGVVVTTTLGRETLADRLDGRAPAIDEVISTVRAVAEALDAAHRAGLAHGHVHPGNVVWAAEPALDRPADTPVLVDLGLARFRDDPAAAVASSAWRDDRQAAIDLARSMVAVAGEPTTTRMAAVAELVGRRGAELVDAVDGLGTLATECERIAHRPDLPLPSEDAVPVTSAPLRPPRSATRRPSRRGRHRRSWPTVPVPDLRVLGGVALAVGLVIGTTAVLTTGHSPDTDDARPASHRSISGCGPPDTAATPPGRATPVSGLVDLDDDGCADVVWWSADDATLHVRTDPTTGTAERFRLGRPGDELVVGDWNCDGTATPGLYRPATGETFRFDRWASAQQPVEATPGPLLQPGSAPHTDRADGGCDRIVAG